MTVGLVGCKVWHETPRVALTLISEVLATPWPGGAVPQAMNHRTIGSCLPPAGVALPQKWSANTRW
jgi:hypothetical protein